MFAENVSSRCRKSPLILATINCLLPAMVLAVEITPDGSDEQAKAIYHEDVDHLWNRLHEALFVRSDDDGNEYGRHSLDPWLWPTTSEFLLKGESHKNAIKLLDEFNKKGGASLIADPVKRVMFQNDLWAVFDWAAAVETEPILSKRLARAISLLSLDNKTIAELPNNFQLAVATKSFDTRYDETSRRWYLPADLFDPEGPWVCMRGAADGPSAPVHANLFAGRSPFIAFLKLPDGRQATLDYMQQLNEATAAGMPSPLFPEGTTAALVRYMTAIDRADKIVVTPIVQSIQLRVHLKVTRAKYGNRNGFLAVFKFNLDRKKLFAKKTGGLAPVTSDKNIPIAFMAHHTSSPRIKEDPFELPIRPWVRNVMKSCVQCHTGCGGGSNANGIFTYNQGHWYKEIPNKPIRKDQRLIPTDIQVEQQRAIHWKTRREEWRQLQRFYDIR